MQRGKAYSRKEGALRTRVRTHARTREHTRMCRTLVCRVHACCVGTVASKAYAVTAPGVATMPRTEKRMPATPNRSRVSLGSLVYAPQNPRDIHPIPSPNFWQLRIQSIGNFLQRDFLNNLLVLRSLLSNVIPVV
jgi:hypothetical protein